MAGPTVTGVSCIGSALGKVLITWLEPTDPYNTVRIVWRNSPSEGTDRYPNNANDGMSIGGAAYHDCTGAEMSAHAFEHTNLTVDDQVCHYYGVFASNDGGVTWGTTNAGNQDGGPNNEGSFAQAYVQQLTAANVEGIVRLSGNVAAPDGYKVFVTRTTPTAFSLKTSEGNLFVLVDSVNHGVAGAFKFWNDGFGNKDGSNDTFWTGNNLHIVVKNASDVVQFEMDHVLTARQVSCFTGPMFDKETQITVGIPVVELMPLAPTVPVYNPSEPDINPPTVQTARPSFVWTHSPDRDNDYNTGKVDYAIEYSSSVLPLVPEPHDTTEPTYYLRKTLVGADQANFSIREKVSDVWGSWTTWGNPINGNTTNNGYKMSSGVTEAQIKFTVPVDQPLTEATWYWRVYVTDKTLSTTP